jgi:hypothetical protein
MLKGYASLLLGVCGIIASLTWNANAYQGFPGVCGGYQGNCWCKYQSGSPDYYYYCKNYQRLTYTCTAIPGAPNCVNNQCKCYTDYSTPRVKCMDPSCAPACVEISEQCSIVDQDCRDGISCESP